MSRYFRLKRLGNQPDSMNFFLHVFTCCLLSLSGLVFIASNPGSVYAQESEPGNALVEQQEDDGTEYSESNAEMLAAMKSLDQALNQKEILAEREQTRDRLVGFGVIGGAFLALVGVLFAYLRLDHATRGFHSGRLQLLSGLISVVIIATCYFLWTQVLFK